MTGPTPWTLTGQLAQLRVAGLEATVDLDRPELGLHRAVFQGTSLAGWAALGVTLNLLDASSGGQLIESYIRGADLIATYAQTPERPVRVQAYWRAEATGAAVSVTLQVSVQTSHWQSEALRETASVLPPTNVLRLGEDRGFHPLATERPVVQLSAADGPACLLFRDQQAPVSYAEMIHPADYELDELVSAADSAGTLVHTHRLFAEQLEKGVIRRARIRGVWMPRDGDEQAALAAYEQLCQAPPPLTA